MEIQSVLPFEAGAAQQCVCARVCGGDFAIAFTVVALGVQQIQGNGNTLESNSCSVRRGKTKPKNECRSQVEVLASLSEAVKY